VVTSGSQSLTNTFNLTNCTATDPSQVIMCTATQ
jgi:hypothetical protein